MRSGPWIVLAALACSPAPQPNDEAVAWVDGEAITVADLEAEVARRGTLETMRFATPEERRTLLDEIIHRRALAQRARRAGYERDARVRADVEALLGQRFEADQLRSHAQHLVVTAEEVEAEYRGHLDRYTEPERVQAALIWIPVPSGASAETHQRLRGRADQVLRQARDASASSGTFGALAVRYSADFESRYRGGDVGWLERDSTDPRWGNEVARAVFALVEPGELTEVIAVDAGFAIAKLLRRSERRTAELAEVEGRIRQTLERGKLERVRARLREELDRNVSIRRDEERLDAIPLFAPLETAGRSGSPG